MDFGNLLSGVASGNPLQAAAGFGSFIGSIFGGHGVAGHELPDIDKIAAANQITSEQAAAVCSFRESHDKANYDDICKKAASDSGYFQTILNEYNQAKPYAQIVRGNAQWQASQYQPGVQLGVGLPGTGAYASQTYQPGVMLGTPVLSQAGSATMSLGAVNSLTQQDIKNILAGAGNGALAGAQTAAMNTPEGQAATKAAMESYIKEYQLPIAAGVGGIIWLAVKAFSKK
jgi:hypothetical protein